MNDVLISPPFLSFVASVACIYRRRGLALARHYTQAKSVAEV